MPLLVHILNSLLHCSSFCKGTSSIWNSKFSRYTIIGFWLFTSSLPFPLTQCSNSYTSHWNTAMSPSKDVPYVHDITMSLGLLPVVAVWFLLPPTSVASTPWGSEYCVGSRSEYAEYDLGKTVSHLIWGSRYFIGSDCASLLRSWGLSSLSAVLLHYLLPLLNEGWAQRIILHYVFYGKLWPVMLILILHVGRWLIYLLGI